MVNKTLKKAHVIFTCMYSVMRAPQCANAVTESARACREDGSSQVQQPYVYKFRPMCQV